MGRNFCYAIENISFWDWEYFIIWIFWMSVKLDRNLFKWSLGSSYAVQDMKWNSASNNCNIIKIPTAFIPLCNTIKIMTVFIPSVIPHNFLTAHFPLCNITKLRDCLIPLRDTFTFWAVILLYPLCNITELPDCLIPLCNAFTFQPLFRSQKLDCVATVLFTIIQSISL